MWLIFVVVVVIALVVLGSVAFGGVFSLVTVPIVVVGGLVALFWRVLARSMQEKRQLSEGSASVPSSTEANRETRREPRSPSDLVDARRTAQ
jgi:hypothetical protein